MDKVAFRRATTDEVLVLEPGMTTREFGKINRIQMAIHDHQHTDIILLDKEGIVAIFCVNDDDILESKTIESKS
jgi:hypothetical protein